MPVNRFVVGGNLTRDPETREVGDSTVTNFTIAHNPGRDKPAIFFRVDAWGRLGETCAQYLGKGSQAVVDGRLQVREYESNGETRTSLEIRADNVQFVGGRPEGQGSATHAGGDDDDDPISF